jgi:prepilin-type N-terminal cleavage/methylation domain-containing protein
MRKPGYKTKLGKRRFKMRDSELRTHYSELLSENRGFTFIEVVIVIVILSIVSVIGINFLIDSLKVYTLAVNQKTLFDEGKLALERMVRDIRDARAVAEPDSGETVDEIRITRTNATAQDYAGEAIRFVMSGTTLQKRKSDPSVMLIDLASNVSTFTATRGATTDEITIVLILSLASGENVTLQTTVYPKNLGDNTTYRNYFRNWEEELSS